MSEHRFSIIQGKAVTDKRVSNAQLRTLAALGQYTDKDGWCWPSQSTIGDDLGKSRQTVNEDIAALVGYGYVEKWAIPTGRGKEVQVKYRLIFDFPKGDVGIPEQGVSSLPDSNVPMNDSYNVNTVTDVPDAPMPDEYSLEWQISAGKKTLSVPNNVDSQYKDSANLLAMTFGTKADLAFSIAYTFMKVRGILVPESKIKGQRKAVKEMMDMGVKAKHVEEAVKTLLANKMTVTDLFSISKTAISLANPPADNKPKKFQTYTGEEDVE